MNRLIAEGIATLHLLEDGRIDAGDVLALNGWIRGDADRLALFTALHGDDDGTVETGFHLVKGDGAGVAFHHALADTVADGIYHVGFAIQDGHFLNEDGNPNAAVQTVADQLDYYFADLSMIGQPASTSSSTSPAPIPACPASPWRRTCRPGWSPPTG